VGDTHPAGVHHPRRTPARAVEFDTAQPPHPRSASSDCTDRRTDQGRSTIAVGDSAITAASGDA
jgi:hypothetical protein